MEGKITLAKSPLDMNNIRHEETLLGHTEKVVECFHKIFGIPEKPTRLAKMWLKFFKIGLDQYTTFYLNGISACALHDIGKANNGMQDVLRRNGSQVIYHEHLSGLILMLPEVRSVLSVSNRIDFNIVLASVIGHHLRADEFVEPICDREVLVIDFESIQYCFALLQECIDLAKVDLTNIPDKWSKKYGYKYSKLKEELINSLEEWWIRARKNQSAKRMLMAVRSAIIISDSVGSGIFRTGKDLTQWLASTFSDSKILSGLEIEQNVINPRIRQIEAKNKCEFQWSDFQDYAATLPELSLLLAACGAGKTLAAWRWIRAQLSNKRRSRVIFLYPTRATATEGFKDYVSWAPEADAALIHGTSSYELLDMFGNENDSRYGKDFTTEQRLFALAYWQRRIFTATVDQFLGFLQNSYASICLLTVLVDSVVVIDEVHSFDRSLFSGLKNFLKEFDIPVLCMTASLPKQRFNELQNCGLTVFPNEDKFPDLEKISNMPRYRVKFVKDEADAIEVVKTLITKNKKILWVVNSVERCQNLARQFSTCCYHSQFKLEDRKQRHEEVITVFNKKGIPVLVITTQVCEMSLDISSDVLISELCPITAMIQRMGRNNRFAKPGDEVLGEVFFYPPENLSPYSKEDMVGVDEFICELVNVDSVSQSMLQQLLERLGPSEKANNRYMAFLEDGPWVSSREASLRDTNDYKVPAILDSDINRYVEMRSAHKPTDGLMVSVPRKFALNSLGRYPLVAPGEHYSAKYGFCNKPLEVKNE